MMMLSLFCPSMGGHDDAVASWQEMASRPLFVSIDDTTEGDRAGFLTKCDRAWRETDAKVIGYLHSDLFIHEPSWDRRVMAEFTKPDVGVVGFVGATRLGRDDLYKTPYDFRQLARGGVWSNLTDWRSHGQREERSRRVAVVDSCAVFVRRELLARCGGWPVGRYPNSSHCSDLWLCASGWRCGMASVVVGVECTHRSGGKGPAGTRWMDAHYGSDVAAHRQAHELIYQDFQDVLPMVIE